MLHDVPASAPSYAGFAPPSNAHPAKALSRAHFRTTLTPKQIFMIAPTAKTKAM